MTEQPRPSPLLVTLTLDESSQERLDALRRAHFPPERNHLQAHVTLFHALPGAECAQVKADLDLATHREPFPVRIAGLFLLGRGVAFDLASDEVHALRRDLAASWASWLTRQDAQRFRPHVTVANKIPPERARELHERLSAGFMPWEAQAIGLDLWRYEGGPWQPLSHHPFSATTPHPTPR